MRARCVFVCVCACVYIYIYIVRNPHVFPLFSGCPSWNYPRYPKIARNHVTLFYSTTGSIYGLSESFGSTSQCKVALLATPRRTSRCPLGICTVCRASAPRIPVLNHSPSRKKDQMHPTKRTAVKAQSCFHRGWLPDLVQPPKGSSSILQRLHLLKLGIAVAGSPLDGGKEFDFDLTWPSYSMVFCGK